MLPKTVEGFTILAIFFSLVAVAVYVESTAPGKRLPAVITIIITSIVLGNIGLLPASSPVYDVIWYYLVPMAIALFLLRADLVSAFAEGGRVLLAFGIGAVGVVLGVISAVHMLNIGSMEPEYAGIFTATYIGGSLNFAAVAQAIGFDDRTSLSAALAIDNVLGIGYILVLTLVPSIALFTHTYGWREASMSVVQAEEVTDKVAAPRLFSYVVALGIASAACAIGTALSSSANVPSYSILAVTALMVAVATLGRNALSRIEGEETLALIFMYLFFAYLGTGADVLAMLSAAPNLFALVLLIFAFHLTFLLFGAYFLRINYAEIVVASLACIGGPPVATAVAILFGWDRLVIPGIVTGVFGYAIGTFVGIAMVEVVKLIG